MRNTNVKALCEGALVTALTVVLLAFGIYVPMLNIITAFVSGVPLAVLSVKRGAYVSVASFAASMLLMFVITGNIISGPLSAFITLLPALVIGVCIKNDIRYYYILTAAVVAVLFGFIIDIMLLNATMTDGSVISDMLDQSIETVRQGMNAYIGDIEGGETVSELLNQSLEASKLAFLTYFPTIMLFFSTVMGYILLSVIIFFIRRMRVKKYEYVRFYMLRVPRSLVIVTLVIMLVSMFSVDTDILTTALRNVALCLELVLAICGMSTIDFMLRKRIKSGYKRFWIYVLVFILGYMLISLMFYALIFLGIFDACRDIRKLKKAGGK